MSSDLFKNVTSKIFTNHMYLIYMYKQDLVLNNLQWLNRLIGQMGGIFANGPGDQGSIPGCVIPKTLKKVFDTSLLNTQQYKARIKSKVEQSRERSCTFPYPSV